jgi:hypothetical protein
MIINETEYVSGVFRGGGGEKMVTHLYRGNMANPGFPMCSRGWQRKYFDKDEKLIDWDYSIFRNNWSEAGECRICRRRAEANLPAIETPKSKYDSRNQNHYKEKA